MIKLPISCPSLSRSGNWPWSGSMSLPWDKSWSRSISSPWSWSRSRSWTLFKHCYRLSSKSRSRS